MGKFEWILDGDDLSIISSLFTSSQFRHTVGYSFDSVKKKLQIGCARTFIDFEKKENDTIQSKNIRNVSH